MGPLSALRVIEMAGIGPAPYAAMLLADMGADVVRLERPERHGLTSLIDPRQDLFNRGKRSVAINLKQEDGPSIALRLIQRADVLLEGFRPAVMERLGLGPERCLALNPRLIYARMTGWGQHGPLAARAGHDVTYIAVTGALHAIGPPHGSPCIPLNLLGDFGGGALFLMVGILAALAERTQSGRGQVVDAAIVDGVGSLLTQICALVNGGVWTMHRGRNLLDGGAPWYGVYETIDGRHMAVGAIEPQFYAEFLARLGLDADELPGQWEVERWPELRAAIAAAFKERAFDEWTRVFAESDACVAPVLSVSEARVYPHLAARQTFIERDGVPQPAPAPRFSRTPGAAGRPCAPGEHTQDVLREVDLTDAEIADLRARGVVA
jgi:alpha-methylacyl-CoA racemase